MSPLGARLFDDTAVLVSSRSEGDARTLAVREALLERPFALAHQVHGARVARAVSGGARPIGDALVGDGRSHALAMLGADCALVAIAGDNGEMAAVHAGWRGLLAGVIGATVDVLRSDGATEVRAVLGPHIGAECYEFSAEDLERVEERLGFALGARTSLGSPALDLGAGIRRQLEASGAELVAELGGCGACGDEFFSHRARRDTARHLLAVYRCPRR